MSTTPDNQHPPHEDLASAVNDARRLLRGFRAFDQVAAAIETAQRSQQLASEAEARRALAATELEQIEKARGVALQGLAEAREKAAALHTNATGRAEALVKNAEALAAERLATSQTQLAASLDRKAAVDAEVLDAQKRRDALRDECAALEERLAKASRTIDQLMS